VASRRDLDFSYTLTDRVVRLSLGEFADFSGAKYDGDFSLSLAQAQRRKYEYVDEQVGIGEGRRVLDLGCGWGALLDFVRDRGGRGLGVTLSGAHVTACRRHGLDVHLHDAREVDRESFGPFDSVTMLGALEHICSQDDFSAGRQPSIYRDLFANVADLLPDGGRFYLQTMVYGRNMIPASELDIELRRGFPAPGTDEWHLALLGRQFPGSWLPEGPAQLVDCASPHLRLVSRASGRLDYIETIRQWNARVGTRSLRKTLLKLQLVPRWLTSGDFRLAFTSGVSANKVCFERELLDHCRLVFEKV
jgi:cyclopropane-fatty-acyl-phospholipid synthase